MPQQTPGREPLPEGFLRPIDPNATLEKIRNIVRFTRGPSADMQTPAELLEDLVEAADRLDAWISGGGPLPAAWTAVPADGGRHGPVVADPLGTYLDWRRHEHCFLR